MGYVKNMFWLTRVNQKCCLLGYKGPKVPKKGPKKHHSIKARGFFFFRFLATIFGLKVPQNIISTPLEPIVHICTDMNICVGPISRFWAFLPKIDRLLYPGFFEHFFAKNKISQRPRGPRTP